jgi:hypothetical protein
MAHTAKLWWLNLQKETIVRQQENAVSPEAIKGRNNKEWKVC